MAAPPPGARTTTELVILFADIAGSTGLYERLGDVQARALVVACVRAMAQAVRAADGRLIKTIGDGVMATFAAAESGLAAAVDMQQRITDLPVAGGGPPLAIRIGLHLGQVLIEEGDIFGDAVNVAARLVGEAKGAQILTSGGTLAAAGATWQQAARMIDITAIRGRREPVEVFEIIWKADEATMTRHATRRAPPSAGVRLVLLVGGTQRLELGEARPLVTIGRGDRNDLILDGTFVSRLHARIEYRRGRCILTDQSTNGTYVAASAGPVAFVRNDLHVLAATGLIGFGETPAPGMATTIAYEVMPPA